MKYLIYSVEDDRDISHIINVTLSHQGFTVKSFYNGKDFYTALATEKPQMILLDMMLPDTSGTDILKNLRSKSEFDDVEIIIVSANRMVMDKVDGLDLGADDYIEKPFDILELMSRVNAKYRRYSKKQVLYARNYVLDIEKHEVRHNNELVDLTAREFDILKLLMEAKGKVISREDMLTALWGEALESRTIDMHIKSLRKKLGDLDNTFIITVYGVGYKVAE